MIYFPDGSTRGYPFPHFAVERSGIEVGAVIDGDVTPIAWPRPADTPIPPLPAVRVRRAPVIANTGMTPPRAPDAGGRTHLPPRSRGRQRSGAGRGSAMSCRVLAS